MTKFEYQQQFGMIVMAYEASIIDKERAIDAVKELIKEYRKDKVVSTDELLLHVLENA
jgi:hypothetical protein